mgnify:CR=1 FL=1
MDAFNNTNFYKENVLGVWVAQDLEDTSRYVPFLLQGGLDITPVITHRFHYAEFEKAFEVMRSGNSGKVILNWEN